MILNEVRFHLMHYIAYVWTQCLILHRPLPERSHSVTIQRHAEYDACQGKQASIFWPPWSVPLQIYPYVSHKSKSAALFA